MEFDTQKKFLKDLNSIFEKCKTVKDLKALIKDDSEIKNKLDALGVDEKKELLDIYKNSSLYTKLINTIVIPYLLHVDQCETSNEYYRIDVVGYKDKDIEKQYLLNEGKRLGLTPYCWGFSYAIEHENAHGKWVDEAIKLAYINCQNRIVIGYNRKLYKGESLELYEKECLKYMINCIEKSNVLKNKDGYLTLFFGERNDKKEWAEIRYNGYVVDYNIGKIYPLQ